MAAEVPVATRRRPWLVVAAGLGAGLLALGGCGDDEAGDDTGDGPPRGEEGEVGDDWPQADGVTLEVEVSPGDRHVTIEFTLTNTGDAAVAVPDPEVTPDRVTTTDNGVVRVSYLGTEGAPGGGDAPPPGEGVLLRSGGSHAGTARALGRGEEIPDTLEVCVEVVADFSADDDGDGVVTFPYRPTDEAPTVACSGPVAVD